MPNNERDYREWLCEQLDDPQRAAEYINDSIQEHSLPLFLMALRDVAMAHEMAKVAERAGVERETAYRMLSKKGNPRLSSLWDLFPALGLELFVKPILAGGGLRQGLPSAMDKAITESGKQSSGSSSARRPPASATTNMGTWKAMHGTNQNTASSCAYAGGSQ